MRPPERILIVGGVAGGASAAARARRLCERCEIIVFDRGPFVSFANCGLPYYVGNVIDDEAKLIVASPELFRKRFNIEVRTENEVAAIEPKRQEIEVRELATGRVYREPYDHLVLSPGARAIVPPLPGVDLEGVFVLRTIPDSRRIRSWIEEKDASRAVVVGGGFIGLEMAENLRHRGLEVTVLEREPQVLPPLDPEMAFLVEEHLVEQGVTVRLSEALQSFEPSSSGALAVGTSAGEHLQADIAILSIGVRPEIELARRAGLEIGELGGIRVDESMRTSDPRIYAVGDAVEVRSVIRGSPTLVPLAGPANRQGRLAADAIFGRDTSFRGVQGTAVCGLFGLTVAVTGVSETSLRRAGVTGYEFVYLHPGCHVGYYPGARPIHLKLIFETGGGRILGAQAVGEAGTERRIDVLSMAIQMGATVFDLEEAELCYAPQYGAAKDPVNLAGMIAANALRGDHPVVHWRDLPASGAFLLDVREPSEFAEGHAAGAVNIPLGELRGRIDQLPRDQDVWVYCAVGQRAYYATRALLQRGVRVRNVSGGFKTLRMWEGAEKRRL